MLLVRHVVCRAHGEFIDADEGASGRIASSCSVTADDESAAPKLGGGNSGGAEKDEHCLLGVVTRTGFLSWRSGDEPRSILREFVACALKKRLAPEASIERILLAPKQSPPNWGSVLLQIGALETA